jgi:hypothetical protein
LINYIQTANINRISSGLSVVENNNIEWNF